MQVAVSSWGYSFGGTWYWWLTRNHITASDITHLGWHQKAEVVAWLALKQLRDCTSDSEITLNDMSTSVVRVTRLVGLRIENSLPHPASILNLWRHIQPHDFWLIIMIIIMIIIIVIIIKWKWIKYLYQGLKYNDKQTKHNTAVHISMEYGAFWSIRYPPNSTNWCCKAC